MSQLHGYDQMMLIV